MPAPPERVWEALTDPARLARWWGPSGFESPSVELDVQVGGSYRILMQPPEGNAFYLHGEFREIDPPRRLTYTFRWEDPDPDDQETVVTLSLGESGAGTQLFLDQGPFATEGRLQLHRDGWSDGFERLRALLSQSAG